MPVNTRTKKLTIIAMLSALAFVVMVVGRIPFMTIPGLTLKYDPKDIVIIIGGFLYGPAAAFAISLLSSLAEMVSVSETGPIGLLMNVVSSCSFACVAALIYKYKRSLHGAVISLIAGCLFMSVIMVLWNYLVTPVYLGFPREAVTPYLLTFFLPFNLIKGGINAAVTMIIYKPSSRVLRSMSGMPAAGDTKKSNLAVMLISAVVIAVCVIVVVLLSREG